MPKAKTPKTTKPRKATPKLPAAADIDTLRPFTPEAELAYIAASAEHVEVAARVADVIRTMPTSYQQDGAGLDAVAHLHYFSPSSDWYITEKDATGDGTAQAFGWGCLNGDTINAELGYVSIAELVTNGVELDLHFEPRKLSECIASKAGTPADEVAADAGAAAIVPTEGAPDSAGHDDQVDDEHVDAQAMADDAEDHVTAELPPEELADPDCIQLPVSKLRAAALVAADKDVRYYLCGVLLQNGPDGAPRLVSTDGHRMLVIGHDRPKPGAAPWLQGGAILAIAQLREALAVAGKHGDTVTLSYGAGRPHATITTADKFATFTVPVIDGKFPDYQRILDGIDLSNAGGEALGTAVLQSGYMKSAAAVAAALGAKGVQAFNQHADKATAFLFAGADSAVMVVMPLRDTQTVTERTASLLAGPVKASIGALRAHVTRCTQAMKLAKSDKARRELEDRKKGLQARIEELTRITTPALPAPQAQA